MAAPMYGDMARKKVVNWSTLQTWRAPDSPVSGSPIPELPVPVSPMIALVLCIRLFLFRL